MTGERAWFGDAERQTRSMRVTPHPHEGLVTLSVWEGRQCTNTVRIACEELPSLIGSLAQALAVAAPPPAPDPPVYLHVAPDPLVPVDAPVAEWMHGPMAVDGDPTDPPVAPDPLVTAVTRAVSALGRGVQAVADTLADKPPPP